MQRSNYVMLAFLAVIHLCVHHTTAIPATLTKSVTSEVLNTTVVKPTKLAHLGKATVNATTASRAVNLTASTNITSNKTDTSKPPHTVKVRQASADGSSVLSTPVTAGRRVAFCVTKATERLSAFAHIHFRDVLTNAGAGWDPAVSEFVAPYDGHYFFIFHAIGANASDFTMSLTLNGMPKVTAYGTLTTFEVGSNSVVLALKAMDKISLELHQGAIYEHPGNESYTSFTGFLLSSV
ncbi:caprin-2 [Procambarus clarkii]|uniref:caprin-2 n=1 Tax=Procambarus clarkii TaxID=6728 RepID=UPI0037442BFB